MGALCLHWGILLSEASCHGKSPLPSLGRHSPVGRGVLVAPRRGQCHVPRVQAWRSGVDKARWTPGSRPQSQACRQSCCWSPLWEVPGHKAGDTWGLGLTQAQAVPASCSAHLWTWYVTFLPAKKEEKAGGLLLDDGALPLGRWRALVLGREAPRLVGCRLQMGRETSVRGGPARPGRP